jgi:MFS family permease
MALSRFSASEPDGAYAWARLSAALALMTIGGFGMFACAVALLPVATEFGLSRGEASLPYTLFTIGFGAGGIAYGWATARFGTARVVFVGCLIYGSGFVLASQAQTFWMYALAFGIPIGLLGASVTFSPLVADTSLWFEKRRGFAIGIVISGNYIAGAIWPPIVQAMIDAVGWRDALFMIGLFCLISMPPLTLMLLREAPGLDVGAAGSSSAMPRRPFGLHRETVQGALCCAGIACCVAMAMPQVHIVAHSTDLGLGAVHGANMLAVMMGAGVVSRLLSGWISDKIGGFNTLVFGSLAQMFALFLFLPFDGLMPLYIVSFLFGLSQGGIVPSYAMIVRGAFPAREAGWRIGTVMSFTLFGMAFGGWLSGAIHDWTGSYEAAILNGIGWNMLNLVIAIWLLLRAKRYLMPSTPVAAAA